MHKTTRATIEAERFETDWNELPASIQDAVRVTVSLGYQYLWVDSLCIVQDDAVEMGRQIALMPHIYQEAAFTIMATGTNKAVDGFLAEKADLPTNLALKLPYRAPLSTSMDERREGILYAVVFEEIRIEGTYNSQPLDARAWTLQERYLSPRVLDFRTTQVSWKCSTQHGVTQPTDGWKVYDRDLTYESGYGIQRMKTEPAFCQGNIFWPSLFNRLEYEFYQLVDEYSHRLLSFSMDRILAISGIAQMMAQVDKTNSYKAGHWSRSLQQSLLWKVGEKQHEPPPTHYQAPSWSWASVNGGLNLAFTRSYPLSWEEMGLKAEVKLIDESAPCGAVHYGRLTGRGRIYRALWFDQQPGYRHLLHKFDSEAGEQSHLTIEQIPMLQMDLDAKQEACCELHNTACENGLKVCKEHSGYLRVHLLLFATHEKDSVCRVVGLVLREVADQTTKASVLPSTCGVRRYSRLGVFHTMPSWAIKGEKLELDDPNQYFKDLFQDCTKEMFEII